MELAELIETLESMIDDAAALGDYGALADLTQALCSMGAAAGHRRTAIEFRMKGDIDAALQCERCADDAMQRA